jgi:hypothetical protein
MSHAVLIDPELIFIGDEPGAVGLDGLAINKEGWGSGLIPDFQIQFVTALRNG